MTSPIPTKTERWLFAALCLLGATAAAAAEERADVRALVEQAHRAYDLTQFDEAAKLYAEAYEAEPLPALLFNLGQCQRQLGDPERALFFYRRYLDHAPDGKHSSFARELVARLEADRPKEVPPAATSSPEPVPAAALPTASEAPASAPTAKPALWRRWWFWAGVGALAAGGATAVVLTRPPSPTLGTGDLR